MRRVRTTSRAPRRCARAPARGKSEWAWTYRDSWDRRTSCVGYEIILNSLARQALRAGLPLLEGERAWVGGQPDRCAFSALALRRLRGEALIKIQIRIAHAPQRKTQLRGFATGPRGEAFALGDGASHGFHIVHHEAGDAVLDDLRQGATGIRDHGRARGQRFHRDQRRSFRRARRNEYATRRRQQALFARTAQRADEADLRVELRCDLLVEVTPVRFPGEYLAGDQQRHVRRACGRDGVVETFFRADASQHQREVPL